MVTGPGVVTDLGLEIGLGAVTGPVREVVQAPDLVVDRDLAQEQDQVQDLVRDKGQAQEQDQVHAQVRGKDPAQWTDRGHHQDQDRVRADKVPLAANGIVEGLHQGTVNVVDPVAPANQDQGRQGVQPAEVVAADPRAAAAVDVAEEVEVEVAVVDADVDPK